MKAEAQQTPSFFKFLLLGFSIGMAVTYSVGILYVKSLNPYWLMAYDVFVKHAYQIFLIPVAAPLFIFKLYQPAENDDKYKAKKRRFLYKLFGTCSGLMVNGALWKYGILQHWLRS